MFFLGFKWSELLNSSTVETVLYRGSKQTASGHFGSIFALEEQGQGNIEITYWKKLQNSILLPQNICTETS